MPSYVNFPFKMRAINLAGLEGNWSEPEMLTIRDIPSPVNVIAEQVGVAERLDDDEIVAPEISGDEELPMMDEDTVVYRIIIEVKWELPPSTSRKKRQAIQGSMPTTRYTIVTGIEAIAEPFGAIPEDSFEHIVSVSCITVARNLYG